MSRISQDLTVNHSVGIAEQRKVEAIRQNYPLRKETLTIGRAGPVSRWQREISQPCQQWSPCSLTVPTELLGSLHCSLILSYLRLSAGASDFLVLRSSQNLLYIGCCGLSYAGIKWPELEAESPVPRLRLSAAI